MKRSPVSIFALSLLVAGCGGDGGPTFGGAPPVGSSFPIDGSNGVAVTEVTAASASVAVGAQESVGVVQPGAGIAIALCIVGQSRVAPLAHKRQ